MADGIADDDIVKPEDLPPMREGQSITYVHIDGLGDDPAGRKKPSWKFLAERYGREVGEHRTLYILGNGKAYSGVAGLIQLQKDWDHARLINQTKPGRAASRGPKKIDEPRFYSQLTRKEQETLRNQFERREHSIKDLCAIYGVSRGTLYELARVKGWTMTDKIVGKT